jgi:hypothetical protein
MGGNTGNIRTQRFQSGTVGYRTFGSIISSGNNSASLRRVYTWYVKNNSTSNFYSQVLNLASGKFKDRGQYFMKSVY